MRKISNQELGRPSAEAFAAMEKCPVTVVLDDVRSGNNTGSFFRTGDAFAIERLCLCGITGTPPDREIHKTALGAETTVEWTYFRDAADAVNELKAQGYPGRRTGRRRRHVGRLALQARKALCVGFRQRGERGTAAGSRLVRRSHRDPAAGNQTFAERLGIGRRGAVGSFPAMEGIESGTVTGGDTETKSVRKNEKSLPVANYNFTFALSKL